MSNLPLLNKNNSCNGDCGNAINTDAECIVQEKCNTSTNNNKVTITD